MEKLRVRVLVIFVTVVFALAASGCGTLLHPERRTATPSNKIDGTTMVLDCLWLLAGVIPGIVALSVDFINETIYYSEGELAAQGGDKTSLNLRGTAPRDCQLSLRVVDSTGRDVATQQIDVKQGDELGKALGLVIPEDMQIIGSKLILAVDGHDQVVWDLTPKN